jgi:hypothetical protein
MAISYTVNSATQTVWAAFFDTVVLDDVASFTAGVLSSRAAGLAYRHVLDLRDMRTPMELAAVCALARMVAVYKPTRFAVIATADIQVEAVQTLQEMVAGDWCESVIALFQDLSSAQTWLGLKGSAGTSAA